MKKRKTARTADWMKTIRWLAIFGLAFSAPQAVFKLSAKVLRPVIEVADDVVNALEEMGND